MTSWGKAQQETSHEKNASWRKRDSWEHLGVTSRARKVVSSASLYLRTAALQVMLPVQQPKPSNQGDVALFGIMRLRQLCEEDALQALQSWQSCNTDVLSVSELHAVQLRLSAAMHARVPLWHVIVESLGDSTNRSGRRKSQAVSTYFMQNLDELRELARQCLVDFLDEDKPDELEEAIRNPQFQDWAYQWYLQSEDLSDIRSVRYICRLPGCNVLLHCIRNDFSECCQLLLSKFSDRTAAKKWLILAEPLRVFNKFEANCFHEAAYCGSPGCLEALIAFATEQGISWKDLTDKNGKTPLDIAKSQVEKKQEAAALA